MWPSLMASAEDLHIPGGFTDAGLAQNLTAPAVTRFLPSFLLEQLKN
jgi:hypothetical protein